MSEESSTLYGVTPIEIIREANCPAILGRELLICNFNLPANLLFRERAELSSRSVVSIYNYFEPFPAQLPANSVPNSYQLFVRNISTRKIIITNE